MFILNPENVGDEYMSENQDLKLAKDELEKLKQDEHERYMAELRIKHIRDSKAIEDYGFDRGLEEGIKRGIQQGIQQGRQQGREQLIEIIKKLKELKMPMKQIVKLTGLTEEEVKNI